MQQYMIKASLGFKAKTPKNILLIPSLAFTPYVTSPNVLVMSAYFCPHSVFNSGYLIEFVCLKIDLIGISYDWVY